MSLAREQKAPLEGYQIDLDGDRHVWVARRGATAFIQFKNKEGDITRIALSDEAASALHYLLNYPKDHGHVVKAFLTHMTEAEARSRSRMEWREIKIDGPSTVSSEKQSKSEGA